MSQDKMEIRQDLVDGVRLQTRFLQKPERENHLPIVLVHGFSVSSDYLVPLAMEFGKDFNVFVPDLPGFGHSEDPPYTYTIHGLARSLRDWMDCLDLGQVLLLGHSLGCLVVIEFAISYPGRAPRAILASPAGDPTGHSIFRLAWRLLKDAFREPPELVYLAIHDYITTSPVRLLQTLHDMVRYPTGINLTQVLIPTLVLRGVEDTVATQAWVDEAVRLLPHGYLAVAPGAHGAHFSHAHMVGDIVQEFLNSTSYLPLV
jgi:pimeloyl-ACP methyl ester carboxylesterase